MSRNTYAVTVTRWDENEEVTVIVDRYITADQAIDLMIQVNAMEEEAEVETDEEEEAEEEAQKSKETPAKRGGTRKPTYDKDAMIADIHSGMPVAEIAAKYGVTTATVYQTKSKAKQEGKSNSRGLPSYATRVAEEESVFDPETREQIKDLRDQGMSTSEISEELNLDKEDVAKVMSRGSTNTTTPKQDPVDPGLTAYGERAQQPRKPQPTIEEKVTEMVKQGLSVSELSMAFPSVPQATLVAIYEKFNNN